MLPNVSFSKKPKNCRNSQKTRKEASNICNIMQLYVWSPRKNQLCWFSQLWKIRFSGLNSADSVLIFSESPLMTPSVNEKNKMWLCKQKVVKKTFVDDAWNFVSFSMLVNTYWMISKRFSYKFSCLDSVWRVEFFEISQMNSAKFGEVL